MKTEAKSDSPVADMEVEMRRLKNRIVNVIPPGTEYLETLLKLSDMAWTDALPTAAITGGGTPRLLFNRDFVEAYCTLDEELMMLVLHELHHVLYGHHLLFPGAGEAHNIAFDAVINARLCRTWRSARHARLFRRFYNTPGFPEILLCPPPGWPDPPSAEALTQEKERLKKTLRPDLVWPVQYLRNKLYLGNGNDVTYEDVLRLLQQEGSESESKPNLLGNHSGGEVQDQTAPGTDGSDPSSDAFLISIAREMEQHIERAVGNKPGGNMGLHEIDPPKRNPKKDFLNALRAVLIKAGVYQQRSSRHRHRALADSVRQAVSILPDWRDRTVAAKEALLDAAPLLFNHDVPARTPIWQPSGQAHVYLDVSGSMCNDIPWIVAAVAPLEKAGLCRIYLFSTTVFDGPKEGIASKRLKTTLGTDIDCVLQHILDLPRKKRPRQVVVLTDGYFSRPPWKLMTEFKEARVALHGAITHDGSLEPMDRMAASVTRMPGYN